MKFSIRDLLLVTVIVALAVGWWVEYRRRKQLEIENDAALSRLAIDNLHLAIRDIELDLKHHGLTLDWSNDMRASVKEIDRPNSSAPAPKLPKE